MAREPFQAFSAFVAPLKHKNNPDGFFEGTGRRNADEMVAYDGTKSHIKGYNFCFFCEERLEVVQDD